MRNLKNYFESVKMRKFKNFYCREMMPLINIGFRIIVTVLFIIPLFSVNLVYAKAKQTINIAYLTQEQNVPPPLSNLDVFIKNKGVIGAELGIDDDNTTGEFTGQHFNLKKFIVPLDGNIVDTFNKELAGKFEYVVVNLPAEQVNQLADLARCKANAALRCGHKR